MRAMPKMSFLDRRVNLDGSIAYRSTKSAIEVLQEKYYKEFRKPLSDATLLATSSPIVRNGVCPTNLSLISSETPIKMHPALHVSTIEQVRVFDAHDFSIGESTIS